MESQAMDRVHRIGQTKPVRVVRMVSADSVEDRILEIQEAKEALGTGALRKVRKEDGSGWAPCCFEDGVGGRQAGPTLCCCRA